MTNKKRVLVVGDGLLKAKEIGAGQFEERAWELCGEADTSEQAIEMIMELRPDLVVLDASMPTNRYVRVAADIRRAAPGLKICFFGLWLAEREALTPVQSSGLNCASQDQAGIIRVGVEPMINCGTP